MLFQEAYTKYLPMWNEPHRFYAFRARKITGLPLKMKTSEGTDLSVPVSLVEEAGRSPVFSG